MPRRCCCWWMVPVMVAGAFALPPQRTELMEKSAVMDALSTRGITLSPLQVEVLSPLRAASSRPVLEVEAIEPWRDSGSKVRMRCRLQKDCLPFYVLVSGVAREDMQNTLGPKRGAPKAAAQQQGVAREVWLVRRGEKATLELQGAHVLIELPVMCLNNGAAGATVRVTTPDHKRIFRAEVVGAGRLKGSL